MASDPVLTRQNLIDFCERQAALASEYESFADTTAMFRAIAQALKEDPPQLQEEKDVDARVETGATIPVTGSTAQSATGDK